MDQILINFKCMQFKILISLRLLYYILNDYEGCTSLTRLLVILHFYTLCIFNKKQTSSKTLWIEIQLYSILKPWLHGLVYLRPCHGDGENTGLLVAKVILYVDNQFIIDSSLICCLYHLQPPFLTVTELKKRNNKLINTSSFITLRYLKNLIKQLDNVQSKENTFQSFW